MNENNTLGSNHSDNTTIGLQRENWALKAHAEAATVLLQAKNQNELIRGICRAIVAQVPYLLAWVGFAENDEQKSVRMVGVEGLAAEYAHGINVSWSEKSPMGVGPTGTCIRTGLTVVIGDSDTDPRFEPWRSRAQKYDIRSVIAIPIVDRYAQPVGALTVYASMPEIFTEVEIQLFQGLADNISIGLVSLQDSQKLAKESQAKTEAQEALTHSLQATIEAMSRTMEWRDLYTAGHQKRVAAVAVAIAKKLGWPDDKIQGLYLAAMVHDIGKLAIPAEILTKPTHLTDLEMQMMRGHVEAGYQILKDIPFSWPIATIVRQHHERLDGSGYPNRIKGKEIIPEARVLAVADILEAMVSHRPYRPAKGLKMALAQIQLESGVSLDPEVVKVACELIADPEAAYELFGAEAEV